MSNIVFVMRTTPDGMPAGFYPFERKDNSSPPWAFDGYHKMVSTNAASAALEFEAAYAAFWDARASQN